MADQNVNSAVDQLLQQLQQPGSGANPPEPVDIPEISSEDMEKFLLKYSTQLIKGSVEFVEDLKQYITSAPDAKDVEAMSGLIASSASAIETLNKILIAKKNNEVKVRLKTMDIESKKQLQEIDNQGKLLMNREELLKQLLDDAKIVDVDTSPSLSS
jgi:chitinase